MWFSGLRHWSSTDDPWVEHARWSIDCVFVLEQKGQQFVDLIKQALDYRQQVIYHNFTFKFCL